MRLLIGVLGALAVIGVACGGDTEAGPARCVPGESRNCAGPGACQGFQLCNADGKSFGSCDCAGPAGGSGGSIGGSGGATGGSSGTTSGGGTGASGGAGGSGASGGAGGSGASGGVGGGAGPGVDCYGKPCDTSSGAICCAEGYVTPGGCAGGSGTSQCVPSGQACAQGMTTVTCDAPDDCPGMVCCGTYQHCSPTSPGYGSNVLVSDVSCRPAQDCTGKNTILICDPSATDPCPAGGLCFSGSPSFPYASSVCRQCLEAQTGGGFGISPDGTPCNDNDAATVTDLCKSGVCIGS